MIVERRFESMIGSEVVPGVIWSPPGCRGPQATILMGHGRAADKTTPYLTAVAERFVVERGLTAVAIDAPGHGERRVAAASEMPAKPDCGQARDEWRGCLEGLIADGTTDAGAVGYWGLSMGAAIGIALIAAEPKIRCAALGLMHTRYYPTISVDASQARCPVFFSLHWDDSRVPREEGLALFDQLGSPDKRLHAYPGDHADFTDEELQSAEAFLAERLRGPAR